ncbi:MAG: NAD(P)-dependent oxidoreductase [Terriglobia bacterium]
MFRVGITPDFEKDARGVLPPALAEVLDPAAGIEYETMPDTGGIAVAEVLDRYDAVISFSYIFPAASFRGLKRLAVIARWGVGFDQIDIDASTEAGVIVAITRDSVGRSIAEGILALMFSLAKNIPQLDRNCREGRWRQDPPHLINLEGRVLGSIGLGNIATEMIRLTAGLGFTRRLAFSPTTDHRRATEIEVELVNLDAVMLESDFVTVNCPLNAKTRGMITARHLALMKPTAYLINTARGSIVDEAALVNALEQKKIAGAALDVFDTEPIPPNHPLLKLKNVIVTPHLIGRTEEGIRKTSLSACRSVLAVAQGLAPPYVVNPEALASSLERASQAAARTRV